MPKRRKYDEAPPCAIVATLNLINGRWKGVVLCYLLTKGTLRFNELQRHLPGCTPRLLVKQLRELEDDAFITRTAYAVVPPKVGGVPAFAQGGSPSCADSRRLSRSIVACEREAIVTSLTKPPRGCVLTASAIRFLRRATTKLQPPQTVSRRKVRCALPLPACQ